ncbi:MAG: HDOD domain-containing protein [Cellvibrionaceae bacterium]
MGYSSPHVEKNANELKEAIEQGKIDVPVLPEVAHKVMALTQDPESDASQLAAIIQTDPTMGGHVMRIANSAAYTPNSNLVSIQQAIARLGMVEISNIALSTSMNSKMFNAPGYDTHIAIIWKHALATALWSKEVARMMRSNVEAAFLCGLLHSIGRPVILQTIADTSSQDSSLSDEELDELYKAFESSYCKAVANEWGLPTIVAEAIGFYKNFSEAPSESELAATIAFGSELANLMLYPNTVEKDDILNSSALELINLYPDEVTKLIDKEPDIKTGMDTLSL